MKHFVVEIIYTRPFDEVTAVIDAHRAYLQTGYQKGLLLISGPQEPRVGGILLVKSDSLATVQSFCDDDPYAQHNVAKHRIIEFLPKSHIPALKSWVDDL